MKKVLIVGLAALLFGLSAAGAPKSKSIYQLESKWTNQDGKDILIGELKGKIQLVSLIYTHCQYSCPLIVLDIKKILKAVPDDLRSQVHVSLFSFDAENETVFTMKEFAVSHDLDSKIWTLLRSDADSVRNLAAVLGVKYKKWGKVDYSHSNMIFLLDQDGVIQFQRTEIGGDTKELTKKLTELSKRSN